MYGIIYKVTNKTNKKCYIGQTINGLEKRKNEHIRKSIYGSALHFHRALRKYDLKDFKWKIIKKCKTKEQLNKKEIHFIRKYDTFHNGYNMTIGGLGIVKKEQERQK